jgi:hypothetical protein
LVWAVLFFQFELFEVVVYDNNTVGGILYLSPVEAMLLKNDFFLPLSSSSFP